MTSQKKCPQERPLSPHLQIYRPQLTSVMSITHRMTGVVLFVGMIMVVVGLCAVACGAESFRFFSGFSMSLAGQAILAGFLWSFYYHMGNGVRHLIWDTGRGFDLKTVYAGGWVVVGASLLLTVLTWFAAGEVLAIKEGLMNGR